MKELEPLYPSIGQAAEGIGRYFPRDKIVKKIFRKLKDGENLLLSAPRRIGKSTILKYMEKNPKENQIIKYIIVQSVDSSEEFFKKLYNELIGDKEIFDGIDGYLTRTTSSVKRYASRITGFSIEGSVEIGEEDTINYYEECMSLIEHFDKEEKKIILFIDEFPDAVNNILEKDTKLAIKFLQQNREMRMRFSDTSLQFVYTGSTGLKNVVKRLDELDLINDIVNIPISPFDEAEAKELIQRLVLGFKEDNKDFEIDEETIEYILKRIAWRLPYYMQIIVEELFEYFDDSQKPIDASSVEYILSKIVKSNSNHSAYFENWKKRLKSAFKHQDYDFAVSVLSYISKHGSIGYAEFYDMSVQFKVTDFKYILDVLEHDGYISEDAKVYGFNSILLKEWWYINVAT